MSRDLGPVPSEYARHLATIQAMADAERDADLAHCYDVACGTVLRLAAHVAVKRAKGEPLDQLRDLYGREFVVNMIRVAEGTLDARAVSKWQTERPSLLRTIRELAPSDQRKLMEGERVEVVVIDAHDVSKSAVTMRTFEEIVEAGQTSQVFAGGYIRGASEQRAWIEGERSREAMKPKRDKVGDLVLDRERDGVMHGHKFIPRFDMERAVRELKR